MIDNEDDIVYSDYEDDEQRELRELKIAEELRSQKQYQLDLFEDAIEKDKFPLYIEYGKKSTHKFMKINNKFMRMSFFHNGNSLTLNVETYRDENIFKNAVRSFAYHGVIIDSENFLKRSDYVVEGLDDAINEKIMEYEAIMENLEENFGEFYRHQKTSNRPYYEKGSTGS